MGESAKNIVLAQVGRERPNQISQALMRGLRFARTIEKASLFKPIG
jgi:hypothetical protein